MLSFVLILMIRICALCNCFTRMAVFMSIPGDRGVMAVPRHYFYELADRIASLLVIEGSDLLTSCLFSGTLPWKEMASHVKAPQQLAEYSYLSGLLALIDRMRHVTCQQTPSTSQPLSATSLSSSSSSLSASQPPFNHHEPALTVIGSLSDSGNTTTASRTAAPLSSSGPASQHPSPRSPAPVLNPYHAFHCVPSHYQSPFASTAVPSHLHSPQPVLLDMCDPVMAMSEFYAPFFSVGMPSH